MESEIEYQLRTTKADFETTKKMLFDISLDWQTKDHREKILTEALKWIADHAEDDGTSFFRLRLTAEQALSIVKDVK